MPAFTWDSSLVYNNTKPTCFQVTNNSLTVSKATQEKYIYNMMASPAQSSGSFSVAITITKTEKDDAYNAVGILDDKNIADHLRSKGCALRLDTGQVYVAGSASSETLRKVSQGDVVKITMDMSTNAVTFQINNEPSKQVTWSQRQGAVRVAAAARALGWTFSIGQGATRVAQGPLFVWDTSFSNASSKPDLYDIAGKKATKVRTPNSIYNLMASPAMKTGKFSFAIRIGAKGKDDDWNSIGLICHGKGKHLRQEGGCCMRLKDCEIYTDGKISAGKKLRPSGGVKVSDILTVSMDMSTNQVTFQLNFVPAKTVTWLNRTGDVRPAVAARDAGWSFEGVRGWGAIGAARVFSAAAATTQQATAVTLCTWQFEDGTKGSGQWKDCIPSDQTALEKAFQNKSNSIVLTNKWGSYDISGICSSTPSQKNKKTNYSRPMRRHPKGGVAGAAAPAPAIQSRPVSSRSTGHFKWQFEDGAASSGSYQDCMYKDSGALETNFLAKKDTVTLTNKYGTYDVTGLTTASPRQQNRTTKVYRALRRVSGSAVKPAPAPAPAPAPKPTAAASDPPPLPANLQKLKSCKVKSDDTMEDLGKMFVSMMTRGTLPKHWSKMSKGDDGACLVKLVPSSEEYRDALRHFRKTMSNKIVCIERVQNRYLWQEFLSTKMQLCAKNKCVVNERVLFHGTRNTKPEFIWKGKSAAGFDPRLGKGYYGVGAYFAQTAKYSRNYSYNSSSGKQMFLATVLTGFAKNFGMTKGQSLKRAPELPSDHALAPGLYDSVQGGPHDGSIMFIVYEGSMAYPLYMYTYV